MTVKECLSVIEAENNHIEWVANKIMTEVIGRPAVADDRFTLGQWFQYNSKLQSSGLYEDAKLVQSHLRNNGFDVKMNMQTYRLSFHGIIDGGEK